MRDDGTTLQPCLIAGTAVRHSGESFQNYATAADTAPSCTLTPLRNDTALLAQPRKRLPLNMVISEAASRDSSHGSEENLFTTRRESEIQCQCHSDATNLDVLSATLEGPSSLKRFKDTE
ncbi:uncharacterized protein [Periplaneta americana]|uniref:uncharacterized protein isoform X2 n=1 Tax=Periplaneta americana TaxID=6978 RepID=UPI0037E79274